MECPEGFTAATIDIHQRNPDQTTTIHTCTQETPP